ncbi:TetR/AcrR family transcriptional regulator [Mycobacterium ulcerans]|uniref:TetR family transcriptional regulator n=1 Tax=Mycobacterium ulcerans subsp. shinshuense TaxID=1124626 RepID=A0A1B4Y012_MYCUL|nr:TetR/AcrR family transcriptional regulator [Mycobacterium ulcerans]BAV40385.1 TetR family transcriptional regulator [Mycobacterium ulcerans subsp. shinshuense]
MSTDSHGRRWAKTDATQRRILDAATEVFATRGFNPATMAEVVASSGASIGSIYHHFGGKTELFLAIFEQMASAVEGKIEEALQQAGDETDRRRIFELGVRAYLDGLWEHRRVARLLASGDRPTDFGITRRDRMTSAFRSWMAVLELDSSLHGQFLSRALLAIMEESSLMVAACEEPEQVKPVIDATIEWIGRLTE